VQRIWRREGLTVPQRQGARRRLWLNDGSCIRLRPERANYVRSYDFVSAMTHDGRTLYILTLIDGYTRERLAIRVTKRLGRYEVIEALADVMLYRGIPEHIRSDNGPEFVAKELREWLVKMGTETLQIEPGSPRENGYSESFNGKLRDECLSGEISYSLKEAQIVIEKWRMVHNALCSHSALGYRPPAPAACSPLVPPILRSQSMVLIRIECLIAHWFTSLTQAQEIAETWRAEYNESRPHRALGEKTPNEFANEIAASRDLIGSRTAENSP
jgi:putative transposase